MTVELDFLRLWVALSFAETLESEAGSSERSFSLNVNTDKVFETQDLNLGSTIGSSLSGLRLQDVRIGLFFEMDNTIS